MITIATDSDIDYIIDLLEQNDLPIEDIKTASIDFWIYKNDDKIIGVCGLEKAENFGLLRSFAVLDAYKNKGIGTELYNYVIEECKKRAYYALFILTTTASAYFKKQNWHQITRFAVPREIAQSAEFSSLCPDSADCFMYVFDNHENCPFNTYKKGYNCAQSVLGRFVEKTDVPFSSAMQLTTGLTAGVGFKGDLCGAVLGSYLSIGLHYGRIQADDDLAKETTFFKMREFDKQFLQHYPSLYCHKLLQKNVADEKELDLIIDKGYFEKACPVYVHIAGKIVKKILDLKE